MPEQFDLILKNGHVMLPSGLTQIDVGVSGGKIKAIGLNEGATASEYVDCTGLHVLPGVIDTQVHFREPGGEHKETLETGTKAAIAGGVTAIFEMPNTNPLTITPESLQWKLDKAGQTSYCDYAFYLGGTADYAAQLGEWENLQGVCGIKIFMGSSTGSLLTSEDDAIEAVLKNGRRVVAVHAEDEHIMGENKTSMLDVLDPADVGVSLHPKWRSVESSANAVRRVVSLARKTGRRLHVLHITCAEELEILRENKDLVTVEVLPNHLTLHAPDCYDDLGSLAQQNPPIREKSHQEALWRAVQDGTVDIIGSDHAPHTLAEKSAPYPASPSGTPGVQTMVPIMLDHVNHGRLTLERFVDLLCYGPQRVHQIAGKGRIAAGYDADFTIVDMNKTQKITDEAQHSKAGWSPYTGRDVQGWPVYTIIRGCKVMDHDEILVDKGFGCAVNFKETL
jgi:dihydroorotase|tara:strand:+ start:278731 stop:280080 length:1350 start_codon:yes stop_codon:yes gene_type:complete